jgi:hypothetical protein
MHVMAIAVIDGAVLKCTCGDAPAKLKVTSQTTVQIENKLAATVQDMAPIKNIPTFGTCKALTAAASGTPTPCMPAISGPWKPGSTSRVDICTFAALLSTDKLACSAPGVITIQDPGQHRTEDT